MQRPQPAPVRPRVLSPFTGERLLLEDEIRGLLTAGAVGTVSVVGPPGSGKTTALRHLAAVFADEPLLRLVDVCQPLDDHPLTDANRLVVWAAERPRAGSLTAFRLAPWNDDDLIEYLLATHRDRCGPVMGRLRNDRGLFEGCPELWQVVLEQMAADETLSGARLALHRHLAALLTDSDLLERTRSLCLNLLVAPQRTDLPTAVDEMARAGFAGAVLRVLRHRTVQLLLAAERVAAELHGEAACDFLADRLPRELVQAAADLLVGDERAVEHLRSLLAGPSWSHAMAASILRRVVRWIPTPGQVLNLEGAYLDGAVWPEVCLSGAKLSEADLSGAVLDRADLRGAAVRKAVMPRAGLRGAHLDGLQARKTDLTGADLSGASGGMANLTGAVLENAVLDDADLPDVCLAEADLANASLRGARLPRAGLYQAQVAGADFSGADLTAAQLSGLRFTEATLRGVTFNHATLVGCDLEYLDLTGASFKEANLRGALLTGCQMSGCDLRMANLREAGLADVNLEGADLRGANLTGASFHLGSTRSGLLIAPIASEGTRTGFYTDDYQEQDFKAPEEIRKANLCGADLRGARVDKVDFYLVDLRGAAYDSDQAEHFRRCRAIL